MSAIYHNWQRGMNAPRKPAKRKAKPEVKIQENIISFLRSQGWLVVRVNSSVVAPDAGSTRRMASYVAHSAFGKHTAGHPDLVAYRGAQALFFEVKTDKGRMSERQEKFREAMLHCGIEYHLARSVEDVRKVLSESGIL